MILPFGTFERRIADNVLRIFCLILTSYFRSAERQYLKSEEAMSHRLGEEPAVVGSKELTRAQARDHGMVDQEFSESVRANRGKDREAEIFGPSIEASAK
ncbi:MAG: hypothetical protein Q7T54_00915 [Candidatus Levybacteria bacterium]|nr:hypothetical protein [Candidatus Levybacteria bacterium]